MRLFAPGNDFGRFVLRRSVETAAHSGHALWEFVCPSSTLKNRAFQQLFAHAATKLHPT